MNIFPSTIEQILRTIPKLGLEFRIKKTKAGDVEIQIEPEKTLSKTEEEALEKVIQDRLYNALFLSCKINLLHPGTLEKGEGKTRKIILEG